MTAPAFTTCPHEISCPGSDYPLSNYSSEAPDQLVFFGMRWPGGSGKGTSQGWPGNLPPLGSTWSAEGCFGVVTGVSQEDADFLANVTAQLCQQPQVQIQQISPTTWSATGCFGTCYGASLAEVQALAQILEQFCLNPPDPVPATIDGVPVINYPNNPQTCTFTNSDGWVVTGTVAAGQFYATNQSLADQMAYSQACNTAQTKVLVPITGNPANTKINWSGNRAQCCKGVDLTDQSFINVTGGESPYDITDTGGTIPPGLELKSAGDSAWLSGAPTTPGTYQFTIQITDNAGHKSSNTFTLKVVGLTLSTLPDANQNVAYSFNLTSGGGTSPYTYAQVSGSLPTGVTLSSDGTVSGTPTNSGTFNFLVSVTDSQGISCSNQSASLKVVATPPLNPMAWWNMDGSPISQTDSVNLLTLGNALGPVGDFANGAGVQGLCEQISNPTPGTSDVLTNSALLAPTMPALAFTGKVTLAIWMQKVDVLFILGNSVQIGYLFNIGATRFNLGTSIQGANGVGLWDCVLSGGGGYGTQGHIGKGSGNGWHFFVITYDSTTNTLGFDVDRTGITTAAIPALPAGSSTLGGAFVSVSAVAPNGSLEGLFDEFAIYPDVLTSTQLDYLYNSGSGRTWPVVLPP